LAISIRDDGIGIDAAIRAAGQRVGHFDLIGMRERARRLNGVFVIESPPEGGTVIHARVPRLVAYNARYHV